MVTFEVWECKSCGGVYRPPAVTECDCQVGVVPQYNKYAVIPIEQDVRPLVEKVREALKMSERWKPFGEAVAQHFDGVQCPVREAIAEADNFLGKGE